MLLDVRDLSVAYGSAQALDRVSLTVDDGEVVALIGANGAGQDDAPQDDLGAQAGGVGRDLVAAESASKARRRTASSEWGSLTCPRGVWSSGP